MLGFFSSDKQPSKTGERSLITH